MMIGALMTIFRALVVALLRLCQLGSGFHSFDHVLILVILKHAARDPTLA